MRALVMFILQKNLHTNMRRKQHFWLVAVARMFGRPARFISGGLTFVPIQTDLGVQNQMRTFPEKLCFQFSHSFTNEDRNHRVLFAIDSLPEKHFPTRHAFLQALLFI